VTLKLTRIRIWIRTGFVVCCIRDPGCKKNPYLGSGINIPDPQRCFKYAFKKQRCQKDRFTYATFKLFFRSAEKRATVLLNKAKLGNKSLHFVLLFCWNRFKKFLIFSSNRRGRDNTVERLYCKRPILCLASSKILTPSPPGECGGRTHSLGGDWRGRWEVNILRDARHSSVLYICKYFVGNTVFKTGPHQNHVFNLTFTEDDLLMREKMLTWWTGFAKNGSPDGDTLWKPFTIRYKK
jgi:hypothetical protein